MDGLVGRLSVFREWGYPDLPACGPGLAHLIDEKPIGPAPLKERPSRGAKPRQEEHLQNPQGGLL